MGKIVYLNEQFVQEDQATIGIFDAGLLHGAGLFETLRAYNGVPFRPTEHVARLAASGECLAMFSLGEPAQASLVQALIELPRRNGQSNARVRLTLTPGDIRQASKPTVFATSDPLTPYPAEWYEKGVTVLLSVHKQSRLDPTCGFKTLSYLPRLISLREAQFRKCSEAIWFTQENLLAEGAISNVFVVKEQVVKTPPIDTPVLPGITRRILLELAPADGIGIRETPLTIHDLLDADEVFLTNSIMEVLPVTHVERRPIGSEKPGPITQRLAQLYKNQVAKECSTDDRQDAPVQNP